MVSADWPQAQGLPVRKIAFCRRNARSRGEWFLPKAGGLEGFDDMLLLTDRVVEAEQAWMKDYRHATGYHPTTGWIAYRLLREQFPAARGAERRGSIQVSQYCRSSPIAQKIAVQAFFPANGCPPPRTAYPPQCHNPRRHNPLPALPSIQYWEYYNHPHAGTVASVPLLTIIQEKQ